MSAKVDVLAVMACAVQDLDVSGRADLAKQLNEAYFAVVALTGEYHELGLSASMLSVERAEFRLDREALAAALRKLMHMDVRGHQLQDRLQFSTTGREILDECRAALARCQS